MIHSLGRLLPTNCVKRYIHTSKCLSEFFEWENKEGQQIKSDEEKTWEKLSLRERLRLEAQLLKQGVKEWIADRKEAFIAGPRIYIPDRKVDVIARFTGDKDDLRKWVVTCDRDQNLGYSTAELDLTRGSKGLFHGFIDTNVPSDGVTKKAGWVNLKLVSKLGPFQDQVVYDWSPYTHLVFHLRGDGRVYAVNLHIQSYFDVTRYDNYHFFIWTRGGPYWQHVRIPFSRFFFAYRGRIQSSNPPLPLHEINTFSITLADKINGPFQLEIDYVGVEYDPLHIEESAYEQYSIDEDQRFV
ncbi:hypothetical protein QAD02_005534 [Eretmocerus hayati]|uniref:Uncharacterized protein n=1 Tax=Eretmocerus hayati TaxID=131215 RepID=A0ACC2NT38_9HYME|nr:hypothetical protein QAD02_005534 [Eretmocerus hayati]